jgi:putative ABC transport system permease protein
MTFPWRRKPRDCSDEINAHLELDADQLMAEGALPEDARSAARRRFGNITAAQERFYESGRFLSVDRLRQDIRGALRAIRRHPLVYAVAILSLAAGIGSTTASLAIRDTVFRNPPPLYQKPDDLSNVFTITPRGFRRGVPAALYAIWLKQRDAGQVWAAARSARRDDVRVDDRRATNSVRAVTPNLFQVLGVQAAIGRTFEGIQGDESSSVVLSNRVWHTVFDGRADAIGRTLWVAERPYTVIGVMPERFWFGDIDAHVWTSLDLAALPPEDSLSVIVRRPPDVSPSALQGSLTAGLRAYVASLPADRRALRANVEDIGGTPMGRAMSVIFPYLLGGCVVLTWLIACANVAILMIAQWTAREHEISILASLGANRARIVRLLLTESLLIAIAGGGLGICATFAIRGLIAHNAGPMLALFDTSIHAAVLVEAILVTVLTGMLVGLAPALYETRRLQTNPLSVVVSDRVRQRWRHALVVAEIAATVALLVVTGTMVDAYRRTMSADLGFPTRSLIGVGVENAKGVAVAQILDLMNGQPGVTSAAAATSAPMMGAPDLRGVSLDGDDATAVQSEPLRVSPTFFATIGVPLRAGRPFAGADATKAPTVAIVNETLARRLLPGRSAVGAHARLDGAIYTVIGVVGDYRRFPLSLSPPALYLPLAPDGAGATRLQFMLRAPIAAGPLLEALRRDVRRVGTGHTVATTLVLDQVIAIGGSEILAGTYPLVPLIAIGLMLTAAGVYAVLAFAVTRRSKELALRIAIGATARDILRVVTAHSIWLVGAGTTIGIAVTFALSRVVRAVGGAGSFLDTPTWPAFLVPALIIAVVSALATWIPSRRALRLDPAALLRVD